MKINYECIRDLLLTLEETLNYDEELKKPKVWLRHISSNSRMKNYNLPDIAYSSDMLREAGFVECQPLEGDNRILDYLYFSITFEGQQYLGSIRSNKIWSTVKKTFEDASTTMTLDLISTAAISIGSRLLGIG